MRRKKLKITSKDIQKLHVDVAKSLTEGKSVEEIKKAIIVTEAISKETRRLLAEFETLFTTKWNEYCDLMRESRKVCEMFSQQMKEEEDLANQASKLFRERFEKSRGPLSFMRKSQIKALQREEDRIAALREPLRLEIQEKIDAYYPTVLRKVMNNAEIKALLSQFPLEIELQHPTQFFKTHPTQGTWASFFDNFKTANKPKVKLTSERAKWLVEFTSEIVSAMRAQIPLVNRKKTNQRLRAQAAKNKEGQRNLISSFRTQREYSFQLERNESCPYCEIKFPSKDLEPSIQLDHIYPVSKGGQSVIENLVFICAECNSKKSDATLAIFCSRNGLDREKVTSRLLMLGKEV